MSRGAPATSGADGGRRDRRRLTKQARRWLSFAASMAMLSALIPMSASAQADDIQTTQGADAPVGVAAVSCPTGWTPVGTQQCRKVFSGGGDTAETWTVPSGVTEALVEVWGAGGGDNAALVSSACTTQNSGGGGAKITATLKDLNEQTLAVYSGTKPASGSCQDPNRDGGKGFGNGGMGGRGSSYTSGVTYRRNGAGGGGASAIVVGAAPLIVAGGGGGAGANGGTGRDARADGCTANAASPSKNTTNCGSSDVTVGNPGTQSAAGTGGTTGGFTGAAGSAGSGRNGGTAGSKTDGTNFGGGGGGGGGYWGAGGGAAVDAVPNGFGGGAGSSYPSSTTTVSQIEVFSPSFESAGNTSTGRVTITYTDPRTMTVSTEPDSSVPVGVDLGEPAVELLNITTPVADIQVTASIDDSPTPTGNQIAPVLDGTLTATTNGSGIATFSDLSIRGPTGTYTLRFTAPGFPDAVSAQFSLTEGLPSALSLIDVSPTSIPVANPGSAATVTVTALDAGGNGTAVGAPATLVLTPTAGSIGTVIHNGDDTYTATYTGTSSMADSPVTISGTINGISITDNATVTLTPGVASQLLVTTQPAAGSAQSGQVLGTQPIVEVTDQFGNRITDDSSTSVTASLVGSPGTLGGTATLTASSGVVTFTDLQINSGLATSDYQLVFQATGLTDDTSNVFRLAKASQTITFGAAPTPTWSDGGTFAVSATASSGLTVSFASDTPSVCTADGSTTITMVTAGDCIVRGSQAGNDNFAAAPDDTQTVAIAKANQSITFAYTGGTKTFGDDSFSVAAMASATSGLPVFFTSDTTGVCTVTTGGIVSLVAQGTCTLRAAQGGNVNYNAAADDTQAFTVNRGTPTVTWDPDTDDTVPSSTLTPSSLATTSGNGAISYSVDDSTTTNCTVDDSTGVLTFNAAGDCIVRATSVQTPQWESAFTTVTFVITKGAQTIDFPGIDGKVFGAAPFTISATATSGLTVSFTSDDTAVCTVSGTTVTILAAGQCDLEANQAGNDAWAPAPAAFRSFKVEKASPTVTWAPTTSITADGTKSFTPSVLATSNGGAITYAVDSPGSTGCTVDANTAVVSYTTAGTCIVRANSAATDDTAAGSTPVSFVISKASQAITFPTLSSRNYGDVPFDIEATTSAPGRLIAFTSTTPDVCGVNSAGTLVDDSTGGTVSIVGVGTCTIQANQAGDDIYSPAPVVERSFTVAQGAQAPLFFTNATTVTYGDTLTLATGGGSGTGDVTFALVGGAGTAQCTLDVNTGAMSFGTAASGAGTCVVRATKAADTLYSPQFTSDTTISVSRSPQTIEFTSTVPANPLPGGTYAVAATASSGNTVDLTALGGCTLSAVTSPATVTFNATGTCMVVANSDPDANFLRAYEASQMITVGALNQSITFAALTDRNFGSPAVALSATASSGLPVTFVSDDTSVCTISPGGAANLLAVGTCPIRATQAGNAQYAAASDVLRTFTINAVTPNRPFIFSGSPGDGAITLAFSAPGFTGGAPITAYQLVATPTTTDDSVVTTQNCSASPCAITGLINGVEYTVTVAGINTAGVGLASLPSGALTPVTRAAAVGGLVALPNATSIDVSWTPLINAQLGGGNFVRYEVFHRVSGGAWPVSTDDTLGAQSDDSITLTGLVLGTSYDIKVVAITTANATEVVGNTAIVQQYAAVAPDAPEAVTVIRGISDTEVEVSWSAPLSDGGRPVTAYAVTTSSGASCTPSPATDDTCVLTGLPLGTTITVSVTATNAMGTSIAGTATYTTPAPPDPNPGPGPNPLPPAPPVPPAPQPLPPVPPTPDNPTGTDNGNPVPLTPSPSGGGGTGPGTGGLTVTGPNFALTVRSYDANGEMIRVGRDLTLRVSAGGRLVTDGGIYSFNSDVSAYLLDPATGQQQPVVISSGTGRSNAQGRFIVAVDVPVNTASGNYILQINGYSLLAQTRSVAIAVIVDATPAITIDGIRQDTGRVVLDGVTVHIPAGYTLQPMVRLSGQRKFSPGVGLRVSTEDGTFTWQRRTQPRRSVEVYFMVVMDDQRVESNMERFPRMRR